VKETKEEREKSTMSWEMSSRRNEILLKNERRQHLSIQNLLRPYKDQHGGESRDSSILTLIASCPQPEKTHREEGDPDLCRGTETVHQRGVVHGHLIPKQRDTGQHQNPKRMQNENEWPLSSEETRIDKEI